MDIVSVALQRYSTKAFDPSKKLTAEEADKIKTLLQYSPSSTNSQPWHFIVASTEEGKARVAKSAAGNYTFNERKMLDASHVVVFCAKTAMTHGLSASSIRKMLMAVSLRRKLKRQMIKVAAFSPICTASR